MKIGKGEINHARSGFERIFHPRPFLYLEEEREENGKVEKKANKKSHRAIFFDDGDYHVSAKRTGRIHDRRT